MITQHRDQLIPRTAIENLEDAASALEHAQTPEQERKAREQYAIAEGNYDIMRDRGEQ